MLEPLHQNIHFDKHGYRYMKNVENAPRISVEEDRIGLVKAHIVAVEK